MIPVMLRKRCMFERINRKRISCRLLVSCPSWPGWSGLPLFSGSRPLPHVSVSSADWKYRYRPVRPECTLLASRLTAVSSLIAGGTLPSVPLSAARSRTAGEAASLPSLFCLSSLSLAAPALKMPVLRFPCREINGESPPRSSRTIFLYGFQLHAASWN